MTSPSPFPLICVTGLPGTGKSYFSIHLSRALSGRHLNSDRIRSRLGLRGCYDTDSKNQVYTQLFREAAEQLSKGNIVVLDGTFYRATLRREVEKMASEAGTRVFWIELRATEDVIRARIEKQRPYSQADFEVYQSVQKKYEALENPNLILNSGAEPIEVQVDRTREALGFMTTPLIRRIIQRAAFPDTAKDTNLIETHASWVILSDNYAFKIKKPVHFSFMDFSTRELRKHFCERELELNRRLTDDIYLRVLPLRESAEGPVIDGKNGEIIDHCVQLKRLDEAQRMDHCLERGEVEVGDLERIARQLARFHGEAEVIQRSWNLDQTVMDFYDLKKVRPLLATHFGRREAELLDRILHRANQFLRRFADRFHERIAAGFIRDGHGDLHSGNIFLYPTPILFDCIEFNDHFRRVDVLDELAFLSMDLEYHGRPELVQSLLGAYRQVLDVFTHEADQHLFCYYKLYRSNVRLKVTALKDLEAPRPEDLAIIQKYLHQMAGYLEELPE